MPPAQKPSTVKESGGPISGVSSRGRVGGTEHPLMFHSFLLFLDNFTIMN